MTTALYSPRPGGQSAAFDLKGLASLKRDAQGGADADTRKEIARQFEAIYLQMMIKRMREATPRDGLLESDQTRMVQSLGDEQLALQLATPGIGLADALLRQMNEAAGVTGAPAGQGTPATPASPQRADPAGDGKVDDVCALLALIESARGPAAQPRLPGGPSVRSDAPAHVAAFMEQMGAAAERAAERSGVPARLILSQAALESGWGRREITFADGSPTFNVFGIKPGSSWTGRVAHVTTTEYVNGEPQKMLQPFRAYDSYEAAFDDYARLIGTHPRYAQVTEAGSDEDAARLIQQAGYATDPAYADKLIRIMAMLGT